MTLDWTVICWIRHQNIDNERKIDKLDYIKIQNFYTLKNITNRVKW
jgi:hypothetical protein